MTRMVMATAALSALLLLIGTAAPLHAQHDDPNMEWVMDGPLYDRLGGEEMIMGVIDDFVAAAVEEEGLKAHLEGVDQEAWKESLMAQFTFVSGGEIEYEGSSFKESLAEMGIEEASMETVADQLTIALELNEAWPEDVDELLVALELKEAELTEEEMAEDGSGQDSEAGDAGEEATADSEAGDAGDATVEADSDTGDAGEEAATSETGETSDAGDAAGDAAASEAGDASGDAGTSETGDAAADGETRK
ncbi:MAG: hypothetical protein OXH02_14075 [Gemmatimonadetes bacterium]|nr:hypothetical protein [Gemmatimonadota bacterium]